MNPDRIISREESLKILANDFRKAALERRAAELKESTPERRETILAEVGREVRDKMERHMKETAHWGVVY